MNIVEFNECELISANIPFASHNIKYYFNSDIFYFGAIKYRYEGIDFKVGCWTLYHLPSGSIAFSYRKLSDIENMLGVAQSKIDLFNVIFMSNQNPFEGDFKKDWYDAHIEWYRAYKRKIVATISKNVRGK